MTSTTSNSTATKSNENCFPAANKEKDVSQPALRIVNKELVHDAWINTMHSFFENPGDQHLKMKLSFGEVSKTSSVMDEFALSSRVAKLDLRVTVPAGMIPRQLAPPPSHKVLTKEEEKDKKKSKKKRKPKNRDMRSSERPGVPATPARSNAGKSLEPIDPILSRVTQSAKKPTTIKFPTATESVVPHMAQLRELPTTEVYAVRQCGALHRLGQHGGSEISISGSRITAGAHAHTKQKVSAESPSQYAVREKGEPNDDPTDHDVDSIPTERTVTSQIQVHQPKSQYAVREKGENDDATDTDVKSIPADFTLESSRYSGMTVGSPRSSSAPSPITKPASSRSSSSNKRN